MKVNFKVNYSAGKVYFLPVSVKEAKLILNVLYAGKEVALKRNVEY